MARTGGEERCTKGFGEKNKGSDRALGRVCVDKRIILKWIFKKREGGLG